ncbi:MAG: DMT family transporter, partial [Phycisphaerae bacterium]
KDLWLLALAMVGIAIIFAGNASADMKGLIVALASGLFYGLLTLMIRRLRDSDSAAVTVLNNLGSALLLLPLVLVFGDVFVSGRALVLLIIMGVVQFGFPYYLFTLGLVRIPAYQAGLITLAEPVLVPIWTYLAVAEKVPTTTAVGGGIILVALVLFVRTASSRSAGVVAGAKP